MIFTNAIRINDQNFIIEDFLNAEEIEIYHKRYDKNNTIDKDIMEVELAVIEEKIPLLGSYYINQVELSDANISIIIKNNSGNLKVSCKREDAEFIVKALSGKLSSTSLNQKYISKLEMLIINFDTTSRAFSKYIKDGMWWNSFRLLVGSNYKNAVLDPEIANKICALLQPENNNSLVAKKSDGDVNDNTSHESEAKHKSPMPKFRNQFNACIDSIEEKNFIYFIKFNNKSKNQIVNICEKLSNYRALFSLDFSMCDFTDKDATLLITEIIDNNIPIWGLSLDNNNITDSSIKIIFNLCNKTELRYLSINLLSFTTQGIKNIISFIKDNQNLFHVGLYPNDIDDLEQMKYIDLRCALNHSRHSLKEANDKITKTETREAELTAENVSLKKQLEEKNFVLTKMDQTHQELIKKNESLEIRIKHLGKKDDDYAKIIQKNVHRFLDVKHVKQQITGAIEIALKKADFDTVSRLSNLLIEGKLKEAMQFISDAQYQQEISRTPQPGVK